MAELQDGIYYAPGKRPGDFFGILFFRIRHGSRARTVGAELAELWPMWQELREGRIRDLPEARVPGGELTVLIGYGPRTFGFQGAARELPKRWAKDFLFQRPKGGGGGPLLGRRTHLAFADDVRENGAAEDVAVQFIANTKLAVNRAIVETWKHISDRNLSAETALDPVTFYLGFQRDDHRSWIDFHDGISNLRSDERERVIAIEESFPGEEWLNRGTYLAFMRLEVDLRVWRRLKRSEQEVLIGRDKLTGCPLVATGDELRQMPGCPIGGKGIWETENDPIAEPKPTNDPHLKQSHIHRANQHRPDPSTVDSSRIFRQGYEFLEWKESAPGFRVGLNFVSFQNTPERLFRILSQPGWLGDVNFAGDPKSPPPGMDRLLQVYGAGVYIVPPRVEREEFPGSTIFGRGEPRPRQDPIPTAVAINTATPAEAALGSVRSP